MHTEEQRMLALKTHEGCGHRVTETIGKLGYPSRQALHGWIDDDRAAVRRTNGGPCGHYSAETKRDAMLTLESGIAPGEIAGRLGLANAAVIYNWTRRPKRKADPVKRKSVDGPVRAWDGLEGAEEERIRQLELENDVLRGVVEVLKAAGLDALTNREKAILIEHLRQTTSRPLRGLTGFLGISKSSYEHQRSSLERPDKYAEARRRIVEEFESASRTRGYRHITHVLREGGEPVVLPEKVVRRPMSEEGRRAICLKKARRYSSYEGEMSEAPADLVKRGFHANRPSALRLTDITEFGIPCGRRYLSPILDRFDGELVSWPVGARPDAELANRPLREACSGLEPGERPVCHSGRGAHYRWPGWRLICDGNGVTRSTSKKGCSPDNAAMEGFFGRLKNEFFCHRDWRGVAMDEFIDLLNDCLRYHNESRPKESLGWMSPNQHRRSLGLAA